MRWCMATKTVETPILPLRQLGLERLYQLIVSAVWKEVSMRWAHGLLRALWNWACYGRWNDLSPYHNCRPGSAHSLGAACPPCAPGILDGL